jgi:outer membrane immunogenic protein
MVCFAGPERLESKSVASAAAPCDWSGFYVGIHGGVGQYSYTATDAGGFNLDVQDGEADTSRFYDMNGLVGGQVGFNWQKGAAVFGLEADGAWANFNVHNTNNASAIGDFLQHDGEINFLGTVRGRLGLAYENVLVYVTGGVAFAEGQRHVRYNEDEENVSTSEFADWKADDWRVGLVGGVGVEYMMTCNWTIRAETLFTTFQEETVQDSAHQDAVGFPQRFQDEVFMVRLGLNYKFGGGR